MSTWGNTDSSESIPSYLTSNTNVFLVDAARLANATFGNGEAVAHQGWVYIQQGTGFVKNIEVSNVSSSLTYSNTFLSISGSNTSPANAKIVVIGGNAISVYVQESGAGYSSAPTVTAGSGNNATLIFSVVPGGRMGRVIPETLVALSDPQVSDANSGLPYFTGL